MFRFVRFATFIGWSLASIICGVIFLVSSFFLYLTPTLPLASQLKHTQLQTPLRIFSSDKKSIAEFGEKRRTPIDINSVPPLLVNAFIAAEDNRFFEHNGIDIKGLARAVTQLIASGRIKSGGSTITMQVAKNFFLSREKTFIRKFNELFLALKIEQSLSKNEILELYFNKIYLGNRAYGIHAAAQVYYGKSIKELNLAQLAMIAGLPKAPSSYNPIANPDRAKTRRNWILDRMLELDMIDNQEHATSKNEIITASYHGGQTDISAPYVAEMARLEIINKYGSSAYTSGMRVFLTIDSKLQTAANTAIKKGLESYDKRHGYRPPTQTIPENKLLDTSFLISQLKRIKTATNIQTAIVLDVNEETALLLIKDGSKVTLSFKYADWATPYLTVDRTGKKPTSLLDIIKLGDIIEIKAQPITELESEATIANKEENSDLKQNINTIVWTLAQTPDVQGALISIAPEDGAIKALVGGYDFNASHYNRAIQAKRQPGSNFKPFIYLAAIENGTTASTLINDAPIVFEDSNLEAAWRPENSSGKFYGPTRIRKALYQSRNLVSIRLLQETGIRTTLKTVQKFGFDQKELPKDLSLALGSAAVTPIEIASGYSMIANGGYKIQPYLISYIEDNNENIIYQNTPPTVCKECFENNPNNINQLELAPRIADEKAIFILHSILKDVIQKGTGRRALELKRNDLAGKTGTTNDQVDAWFSGFNTKIATTAWVGFDNPKTLGRREYGAKAALPIWSDYMKVALEGMEEAHMKPPEGIVTVRIDPKSGLLAKPGAKDAIFEIFRTEYAPKKQANTTTSTPSLLINKQPTIKPEDIF
jgi:penicillin-binding protein 1A